jgi:hypothetical protein
MNQSLVMASPQKDGASSHPGFYPFQPPEKAHQPFPGNVFFVNLRMETLVQGDLPPVATLVRDVATRDGDTPDESGK